MIEERGGLLVTPQYCPGRVRLPASLLANLKKTMNLEDLKEGEILTDDWTITCKHCKEKFILSLADRQEITNPDFK